MAAIEARDGSTDTEMLAAHAAKRGAAVGFVLVTVGMTLAGLASNASFGAALGLGIFVGLWGGCGFGAMLGTSLCVMRAQSAESPPRTSDRHATARTRADDRVAGTRISTVA